MVSSFESVFVVYVWLPSELAIPIVCYQAVYVMLAKIKHDIFRNLIIKVRQVFSNSLVFEDMLCARAH